MELFDHVKIKSSRITGIIVDILDDQFTVEADVERNVDVRADGHYTFVQLLNLNRLNDLTINLYETMLFFRN